MRLFGYGLLLCCLPICFSPVTGEAVSWAIGDPNETCSQCGAQSDGAFYVYDTRGIFIRLREEHGVISGEAWSKGSLGFEVMGDEYEKAKQHSAAKPDDRVRYHDNCSFPLHKRPDSNRHEPPVYHICANIKTTKNIGQAGMVGIFIQQNGSSHYLPLPYEEVIEQVPRWKARVGESGEELGDYGASIHQARAIAGKIWFLAEVFNQHEMGAAMAGRRSGYDKVYVFGSFDTTSNQFHFRHTIKVKPEQYIGPALITTKALWYELYEGGETHPVHAGVFDYDLPSERTFNCFPKFKAESFYRWNGMMVALGRHELRIVKEKTVIQVKWSHGQGNRYDVVVNEADR